MRPQHVDPGLPAAVLTLIGCDHVGVEAQGLIDLGLVFADGRAA
jgi:hypothetical protein